MAAPGRRGSDGVDAPATASMGQGGVEVPERRRLFSTIVLDLANEVLHGADAADAPVPPSPGSGANLFIEVQRGALAPAYPTALRQCPPPAAPNSRKIHLDQRSLDRALPSAVVFDIAVSKSDAANFGILKLTSPALVCSVRS